jgi:hypothetical protein
MKEFDQVLLHYLITNQIFKVSPVVSKKQVLFIIAFSGMRFELWVWMKTFKVFDLLQISLGSSFCLCMRVIEHCSDYYF